MSFLRLAIMGFEISIVVDNNTITIKAVKNNRICMRIILKEEVNSINDLWQVEDIIAQELLDLFNSSEE